MEQTIATQSNDGSYAVVNEHASPLATPNTEFIAVEMPIKCFFFTW